MPSAARFPACLVILCAPAVPQLSPAAPVPEPALTGGAMLDCSGLPCVDVTTGGGARLKMLIDTGNARSILDTTVARKLGLTLGPLIGRDGRAHPGYATATLSNVRLGDGALGDLPVVVMDLAAAVRKGVSPAAEGSLAYTAFGPRLLRMDYPRHRVELSAVLTHEAPCPADCGTLTLPAFGEHGPPIIVTTGFRVNGQPLTVQTDTLYAGTLLVYPAAVDRLALSDQQRSKTLRTFPCTDGGVQMIEGRAAVLAFGGRPLVSDAPVYFATPGVHTPDALFDGTVGQGLFAGHVLSFDFLSRRFWLS